MDSALVDLLEQAVAKSRYPVYHMSSGAGHDAMIVARRMPAAMLFLRSPGGISHHPDETVLPADVAAALEVGLLFLEELEQRHAYSGCPRRHAGHEGSATGRPRHRGRQNRGDRTDLSGAAEEIDAR
jgi:hypothetical protein